MTDSAHVPVPIILSLTLTTGGKDQLTELDWLTGLKRGSGTDGRRLWSVVRVRV